MSQHQTWGSPLGHSQPSSPPLFQSGLRRGFTSYGVHKSLPHLFCSPFRSGSNRLWSLWKHNLPNHSLKEDKHMSQTWLSAVWKEDRTHPSACGLTALNPLKRCRVETVLLSGAGPCRIGLCTLVVLQGHQQLIINNRIRRKGLGSSTASRNHRAM